MRAMSDGFALVKCGRRISTEVQRRSKIMGYAFGDSNLLDWLGILEGDDVVMARAAHPHPPTGSQRFETPNAQRRVPHIVLLPWIFGDKGVQTPPRRVLPPKLVEK